PHTAMAKKAMTSSGLLMVRARYGSVRKKFRLMAPTTAATSAAVRPPNSATTITNATKAKARLEADVTARRGTKATPSAMAPRTPAGTQMPPRSSAFIDHLVGAGSAALRGAPARAIAWALLYAPTPRDMRSSAAGPRPRVLVGLRPPHGGPAEGHADRL